MNTTNKKIGKIRFLLIFFMISLAISGITAFPLQWELSLAKDHILPFFPQDSGFTRWILKVHEGLVNTNAQYPFIAYGTDWLAFAHLVIALVFVGPLINPVKNIWVVEFGLIACVMVFPLALIAGSVRGIPIYWQLIDCSFGIIGFIPLWLVRSYIKEVELEQ